MSSMSAWVHYNLDEKDMQSGEAAFQKMAENLRFEVLKVVTMEISGFQDVTLCGLVECYHCFRGTSCLHVQGRYPEDGGGRFFILCFHIDLCH